MGVSARGGAQWPKTQRREPRSRQSVDLAGRRASKLGRVAAAGGICSRAQLRQWAAAEVAAGRLLPWLAVAYGFGIVIYFTAEREPAWQAAVALAAACVICTVLLRRHLAALVVTLFVAAIACGFAAATIKTAWIAHPILRFNASGVTVAGFVELREQSQHTDRMVIRVQRIDGNRIEDKPDRVRLSVKRGMAPPPGAFVEVKALLDPPLQPLAPDSYDFARDMYFQGIGASGFVRGAIKIVTPPATDTLWQRADAAIQRLRDAIDERVRAVLPGDKGAIAAMLLNGRRDVISENLFNALFISGVGHVLSISGYHMAVVAGVVFFLFRALLALIPGFADRFPIKKWAAFGALAGTTFYLLLSGAEVATQRSYLMIAIVLIGVLLDRPVLSIRTLTMAALLVLLLAPQAVVHPSFQMSFAATLALVAAYERGVPRVRGGRDSPLHARAALWGVNETLSLIVASLVAGLATTPYAAYHFHRLAPYGVLANLLAMPVISAWVMPMGLLGLIAIPFGFDAECWRQMGYGIDWMDKVSLWVASLPGAVGHVTSYGTGPLLLLTGGLLVVGLFKTPLRWSGVLLGAVGIVWAMSAPRPDVLVSDDGRTFAVRGAEGQFAFHHSRRRHLCHQGVARCRCRCAGLSRQGVKRRDQLRSLGLHRQARKRRSRRLRPHARCVRGGLPPRRSHRDDARCAGRLRGAGRRPSADAATRRAGPAA